jgi:hypothetical protein
MKKKKISKILFLSSLSSFVLTLVLEFSQRYNQILFILRHSTLYLGIAFMISALISYFYSTWKPYLIKRKINLVFINIPTLIILSVSLIWVADSRLNYIAENEVPHYMNEVLYDEYSNKIYESILIGIEPLVEVVNQTDSTLELHIEEQCECMQNSNYLESIYPDTELDYFVNGSARIVVDILITYNNDNSINMYTIQESRLITYQPEGLPVHYGYVSRKLDILNEYSLDRIEMTKSSYYYSELVSEEEYGSSIDLEHHEFTNEEVIQTKYSLNKLFTSMSEITYIMNVQVDEEDLNELAILTKEESDSGEILIEFIESPNKNVPEFVWSIQSMKSNLEGSFIISEDKITYEQSYDEGNVEHGLGHHDILKVFDRNANKLILSTNSHLLNSEDHTGENINSFGDLFSIDLFVEIVNRSGGDLFDKLSRSENPLEIDNISLYQLKQEVYGTSVSLYIDASPFTPYGYNENSNLMQPLEYQPQIQGYFDYYSMLFQTTYYPLVISENNEMINFIIND